MPLVIRDYVTTRVVWEDKVKKVTGLLIALIVSLAITVEKSTIASPGITDLDGCHMDDRGRWHCH